MLAPPTIASISLFVLVWTESPAAQANLKLVAKDDPEL